jgi:uncharacterized lipoprotein NlpE involved in copper resistance
MKRIIIIIMLAFLIFTLIGCSNKAVSPNSTSSEKSKLYTINESDVKDIVIDNTNKKKMKIVTSKNDIAVLVDFVNSLQFKAADEDKIKNLKLNNNEYKINYHISIEDKSGNTEKLTVLNINNNMIFFMGKWYQVNLNAENYVSKLYDKLNYIEYGDTL